MVAHAIVVCLSAFSTSALLHLSVAYPMIWGVVLPPHLLLCAIISSTLQGGVLLQYHSAAPNYAILPLLLLGPDLYNYVCIQPQAQATSSIMISAHTDHGLGADSLDLVCCLHTKQSTLQSSVHKTGV